MPPVSEPTRRERIINATLETITQEGLEGTTMRRVALAADVSVGAITHHFPGREALLIEAMTRYTEETVDKFRDLLRWCQQP